MRLTDPTHGSTSGAQCHSVCQKQLHLSVAHHVRDEGVAGSNPATPTSSTTKALIGRSYLQKQDI
jgi:hypothetical protein